MKSLKRDDRKVKFKWPLVGLFLFAFFALLGSLAIMLNIAPKVLRATSEPAPVQEEKDERAFLWKEGEYPLPVVIDNMKDAWPPEGLEYARIIFEAPVEAGITRLLAIFGSDEKNPSLAKASEDMDFKIGPVRSARPYFVDWAEEFGTLLTHVGGSDAGLAKLKASDIFDLDEFRYGGKYFNRVRDRYAPHSTFTSIDLLRQFYDKVSLRVPIISGRGNLPEFNKWNTKTDSSEGGNVNTITIPYKEPYTVRWEYHSTGNKYVRFVNDKPFLTASGEQITTKNIVVMKTDITIIDSVSRRRIVTDGGGEALVFQDGKVIEGTWKKQNGFTRFYDKEGNEVSFNRGPVWVEVVSTNTEPSF